MKKALLNFLFFLPLITYSQVLTTKPIFINQNTANITIIANANFGNKGLNNYSQNVYVHIGVITNLSISPTNWKYVKFTWGSTDPNALAIKLNSNLWQFTIPSKLRDYFGITNNNEVIKQIAIIFRSGDGNLKLVNQDGSDMFIPIYDSSLEVKIIQPFRQPTFVPQYENLNLKLGDSFLVKAQSNQWVDYEFIHNNLTIKSGTDSQFSTFIKLTEFGSQRVLIKINKDNLIKYDSLEFVLYPPTKIVSLPPGIEDGINYLPGDTSVILVQYAPLKKSFIVIGDFNDWTENEAYQMNMTPDSQRFWLQINGLTPAQEYAYQFLVDGKLRIGDIYTKKVLDPYNDPYISNVTYPNLKPYPIGKTSGIVSILQTKAPQYNWNITQFKKPATNQLIIYEILIRDFLQDHSYQSLIDTIPYLKNLGINAIELMPIGEFEGNLSWGYNPNYYFAVDKYYGTADKLKEFIDSCHANNIAVILDLVLNHCFGSSPLAQLYWDAANNRPAIDNPWLNPIAKHPYNVGNDLNHQSAASKYLVKRVIRHWLTEFQFDGLRFDLSKGFTQFNSGDNVGLWSSYDASRIQIWKSIYDSIRVTSKDAYCILEHFADNREEQELANYGMLFWGNANYSFSQAAQGLFNDNNLGYNISSKARGWGENTNLVGYQESHDEERVLFNAFNYGINSIKGNLANSLKNMAINTAFWALVPGPKLMWQFGELGYDISINDCGNGTISNNCRLNNRPILWNYLTDTNRLKLKNVFQFFVKLKTNKNYISTFKNSTFNFNFNGAVKYLSALGDSLGLVLIGNYSLQPIVTNVVFPKLGIWYNYYKDTGLSLTSFSQQISIKPQEIILFTTKNFGNFEFPNIPIDTMIPPDTLTPIDTLVPDTLKPTNLSGLLLLKSYPNPSLGIVTLNLSIEKPATVDFVFRSPSGKVLNKLSKFYSNNGYYNEKIDLNQLALLSGYQGVIFLTLYSNLGEKTVKIIKY